VSDIASFPVPSDPLRYLAYDMAFKPVNPPVLLRHEVLYSKTWTALYALPTGLQDLALLGYLPKATIDVIVRPEPELDAERLVVDGMPLHTVRSMLFTQLQNEFPGLQMADDSEGPCLQRLLALALVKHCKAQCMSHRLLGPLFNGVNTELISNAPMRAVPNDPSRRRGLLWIWLTALAVWEPGAPGQRVWVEKMALKFPEIRAWSVQNFENLGQRFFWNATLTKQIALNWPVVPPTLPAASTLTRQMGVRCTQLCTTTQNFHTCWCRQEADVEAENRSDMEGVMPPATHCMPLSLMRLHSDHPG
jgi:hypothetical protein